MFSLEAQLIRALINQQREEKDRIPTLDDAGPKKTKKRSREEVMRAALEQIRAQREG